MYKLGTKTLQNIHILGSLKCNSMLKEDISLYCNSPCKLSGVVPWFFLSLPFLLIFPPQPRKKICCASNSITSPLLLSLFLPLSWWCHNVVQCFRLTNLRNVRPTRYFSLANFCYSCFLKRVRSFGHWALILPFFPHLKVPRPWPRFLKCQHGNLT